MAVVSRRGEGGHHGRSQAGQREVRGEGHIMAVVR